MAVPQKSTDLIFLGIAERAANIREGNAPLLKWNVIGLKNYLPLLFTPSIVDDLYLVFALRYMQADLKVKIILRNDEGVQCAAMEVAASVSGQPPEPPLTATPATITLFELPEAWMPMILRFRATPPLLIFRFGRYFVYRSYEDGSENLIGEFLCIQFDPPPLTPDRIAAIKSDPYAAKAVRLALSCNECADSIKVYAALERNQALEKEEFIWYSDLRDSFTCGCGKFSAQLATLRKNLFGLLGTIRAERDDSINFIPLYERATLENIRIEFSHLLNQNPKEEVLQNFIENNPIILRQFPAERILFKPPTLTRYVADFGILTPQKELILIEIESVNTNLLRKNGDHAAPLTHAINQVQNWLQIIDDHRIAAINEMKLDAMSIGSVRGVVIAGRDSGYDVAQLRQMKAMISGRIIFLTYDDLLGSLTALITQIERM